MYSEMNATVLTVDTAPGASVDKGDVLLVLESMKMQIPVLSEHRGTVVSIEVRPAETVQQGKLLVVVRPAE